jgi:hypothetical protein
MNKYLTGLASNSSSRKHEGIIGNEKTMVLKLPPRMRNPYFRAFIVINNAHPKEINWKIYLDFISILL